jgi:carboxypeptidase T
MKIDRRLFSLVFLAFFIGNPTPIPIEHNFPAAQLPTGNEIASTQPLQNQVSQSTNPDSANPNLPAFPYRLIVVRAYYSDPKMLVELAGWLEPWEVHAKEGYLVVGVTEAQYDRLLGMGFRLEIDWSYTEQMSQIAAPFPGQANGIPGFDCYRTVAETFASAQTLVDAHPGLATWIDIGDSWDKTQPDGDPGSDMLVLRLTNSQIAGPKPKLFIMASIHAREYAPAELATRFAEYLLANYGTNPDITWLLDYQEIHLLLQANPDGRKLAETRQLSTLMWRKNTRPTCYDPYQRGVDLNRNFEFLWGVIGASNVGCDETYRGESAGSEPETQAVQSYLRQQYEDRRGLSDTDLAAQDTSGVFIDLHSYGKLVLWPWGYTATLAPNDRQLGRLGQKFAYFNQYDPAQSIYLYPTSGTTDDFAYGELGLPAYTVEMGSSFFELCNNFVNTVLPDNIPALLYAARVARTPYQLPDGPDVISVAINPTTTVPGGTAQLFATIDATRYYTGTGYSEPPVIKNILSAEFYIDAQPWLTTTLPVSYTLTALDGIFDQPSEAVSASIDTTDLGVGRHLILIRSRDVAGNWGPYSAAFLFIPAGFLPVIMNNP